MNFTVSLSMQGLVSCSKPIKVRQEDGLDASSCHTMIDQVVMETTLSTEQPLLTSGAYRLAQARPIPVSIASTPSSAITS